MTDLAAEVAELRGQVAELKGQLARSQPAAPVAAPQLVNVQQTRRYPGQGYEEDPRYHPAVTEAILRGASDAEVSRLMAEAEREIIATQAGRRQGPARPDEIEARDRQARRDGQADLNATGRAMMWGMPRGQAIRHPDSGLARQETLLPVARFTYCELGHARRDPDSQVCPHDGTPFRDDAGHSGADDQALAGPRPLAPEDFAISRMGAEEAAALARIEAAGEEARQAGIAERRARQRAGTGGA